MSFNPDALIPRSARERGNMVFILAVVLTLLMSIAGYAIETALYLSKREELQAVAEEVAMAAVLSFPQRNVAVDAANAWFKKLRLNLDETPKFPDPDTPATNAATISITFDETSGTTDVAYKVKSITVRISYTYKPTLFNIANLADIEMVGVATAQLKPVDVVMLIDNAASFYVAPGTSGSQPAYATFTSAYGADVSAIYASQCFSTPWLNFKRGALELYDQLSQIGTFRVSVAWTSSKASPMAPLMIADLGVTDDIDGNLEFGPNLVDDFTSRCAAMTSQLAFNVPSNPNVTGGMGIGPWTQARTDLSSLLAGGLDLSFANDITLLTREAIWIKNAGYSTESGYIPPITYYSNPTAAMNLAIENLTHGDTTPPLVHSQRSDGLPVSQRVVLWLTDDAGMIPREVSPGMWSNNGQICDVWDSADETPYLKLGVLYFGHNQELYGHDYDPANANGLGVNQLRNYCMRPGTARSGIFFAEVSPDAANWKLQAQFREQLAPTIAHALKEAELLK